MPDVAPARQPFASLNERLQATIRRRLWRMDIDRTAKIAASALIDRTFPQGIHIGAHCIIGEEAVILTHDMARGIYAHTSIGSGSVIGARAIVMPGVTIGQDCIVAPGALVLRDLPDRSLAIGNPARSELRQD